MKVTQLSSQKKDSSRVNLYVDGEFFCGLSLDAVAKFGIYQGREIEEKELAEILVDELKNRFSQRAMSYISRAIKTEYQMRRYLKTLSIKKKGTWYKDIEEDQLEDIIEEIITKLKEYDYLDDEEFAFQFITSRIRTKPRGKQVLVSELMSKGVNKDLAKEKVDELVADEYDVLRRVYEKKYKGEKITIRDNKKIDFLKRKGFNWDLIKQLIEDESQK
ncbi:MAG TPA: RecX family transcriptional regulator [Candidatus Dojkabacteria bacterium]|nr:RecX family transcriptional regulator [Candidatus Dojkabacteria bacterium]